MEEACGSNGTLGKGAELWSAMAGRCIAASDADGMFESLEFERLWPELGVRDLRELRRACRALRSELDRTWTRVRRRCAIGKLLEAGALDDLLGSGPAAVIRQRGRARFPAGPP